MLVFPPGAFNIVFRPWSEIFVPTTTSFPWISARDAPSHNEVVTSGCEIGASASSSLKSKKKSFYYFNLGVKGRKHS